MSANVASGSPVYVKSGDLAVRSIAGETILVPVRSGVGDLDSIFVLNETATILWNELDAPRDTEALVAAVLERFDVSRPEAERDVAAHLASLEEAGLVRRV